MATQPSPGAGLGFVCEELKPPAFLSARLRRGTEDGAHNDRSKQLPDSQDPTSDLAVSDSSRREYGKNPPSLAHEVLSALAYALELVRYGALLVTEEGRLRLANRTALSILNKEDGLQLSTRGLIAERASDTGLLLRLLRQAITAPEQGEPRDSPIMLPRKRARTSLIVRVAPTPGLNCLRDGQGRTAMLMLFDQDIELEVNTSLLVKLYGLTRGEATLAASLMRGNSIEEAAKELFISPHTARTHLKRVFMKTNTHRQTELVIRAIPAFAW